MAINQHTVIKKGLLTLILIFLWLVILQDLFEFKKVKPLFGHFPPTKDTVFTIKSWYKGRYQKLREEYVHNEFSLREDYVRIHNSIRYKLFHKTNIKWVVFGVDDQLMGTGQINAYLGTDSLSLNEIERKALYLAAIQDTLKKLGKQLFTTIPPNKPEIFPEYIPSSYPKKSRLNNYERFRDAFKKHGVTLVDFVEFFKQLKASGTTAIFPKNGSHWNHYGSALAMKYFLDKVNESGMFKVGNINITGAEYHAEENGDPDIYATLNLLDDTPGDTTLYPVYQVNPLTSKKPRTIFITDSYFNAWIDYGIYDILDSVTYYFYNNRVINKDHSETNKKFTSQELLDNYDMYVIMCNETNLSEFCWGFAEQLYFHFYPLAPNRAYYDPEFRKTVYKKMNDIKKDEKWHNEIKQKAIDNKIDTTRQLYFDAVRIIQNEQKN